MCIYIYQALQYLRRYIFIVILLIDAQQLMSNKYLQALTVRQSYCLQRIYI